MLVQPSPKHTQRLGTILVLRAFALTLHHDARGLVGHAHGGVGLVHVLAARSAGPVGVDAQILLVDLHLDGVVDLREDRNAREGRVAAMLSVEGRDPHQPMNPLLGLQIAEGVIPRNGNGH